MIVALPVAFGDGQKDKSSVFLLSWARGRLLLWKTYAEKEKRSSLTQLAVFCWRIRPLELGTLTLPLVPRNSKSDHTVTCDEIHDMRSGKQP